MSDTVRRNSQNKVTFLLKESQSRLYRVSQKQRPTASQQHYSSTSASNTPRRKKKNKNSSFLKYICYSCSRGSLSSSCTVGGKSPYVPWEELCWRVTPGSHDTITREFILFLPFFFSFMKCSEACQIVELIQLLF